MVLVAALLGTAIPGRAATPAELQSLPGQVVMVSVNAKQTKILDVYRFERLIALTLSVRSRPRAFNGGYGGAVSAPDVLLVQEMSESNVEIFGKLLNQRSRFNYEIVGTPDSNRKFLFNADTLTLVGEPTSWDDACAGPEIAKKYLFARFLENTTQTPLTVAVMHLARRYPRSDGGVSCRERNVQELKSLLDREPGAIIVGGDFNSRPVATPRECDSNEESVPRDWYSTFTSPTDGGVAYVDAVRAWHNRRHISMSQGWTHEWKKEKLLCDGSTDNQRSRIDYFFSVGTVVAEAHADHPGWAGQEPGTFHPENPPYSDHRFVWGRFVLAGPERPLRPTATPRRGGAIDVSWQPVTGAAGYVVYRGRAGHSYAVLERTSPDAVTFEDTETTDGRRYKYAIAAVDANGAQGLESGPALVEADARGPHVLRVRPRPGMTHVRRDSTVVVRFDERVAPSSVTGSTIELMRKGRPIAGRVKLLSARVLAFNPNKWLRNRTTYSVAVHAVRDRLGNRGSFFSWRFRT
jgi:hypothetical protein